MLAALPAALRTGLYAAAGVVLAALIAWGWLNHRAAAAADERATLAEAAVAQRDIALTDLKALHARQVAALERQATEAEARVARMAPIRRAIDAAPVTQACAASPAVAAALRGLRNAATASGTPGRTSQPASLPSAAGAAAGGR
jgi:hypothetical protein